MHQEEMKGPTGAYYPRLLPGGGGTPYDGLYGEAPPERGIFVKLRIYERVGKSVIWVCKRAQKGQQMNFMAL